MRRFLNLTVVYVMLFEFTCNTQTKNGVADRCKVLFLHLLRKQQVYHRATINDHLVSVDEDTCTRVSMHQAIVQTRATRRDRLLTNNSNDDKLIWEPEFVFKAHIGRYRFGNSNCAAVQNHDDDDAQLRPCAKSNETVLMQK